MKGQDEERDRDRESTCMNVVEGGEGRMEVQDERKKNSHLLHHALLHF